MSRPVRRGLERRVVVLGTAAASAAAIFALRELTAGTGDAISLLYVVPVALVSLELGLRAGLAAAVVAVGAVMVWMASKGYDLDGLALIVRSAIFLSVAAIAGRFSDRMRVHGRRGERLLRSGLDLAQIGDANALAGVLAEHVQRCTDAAAVRVELQDGPVVTVGEAEGETMHVPIASRGIRLGSLTVSAGGGHRFTAEDRLTIETVALQAAVACENQRLLAVEREQAALHSEMDRMRRRLGDQLRNASHVLERHERERRGIARQLHDEAAQAMAAALITVASLERGVGAEVTKAQLEEVRKHMKSCIVDLRRIAGSLRPSVLDEMGLATALQRISEAEADTGREVSFALDELPDRMPRELETSTYRVIEALLDALVSASSIEAGLQIGEKSLRILFEARLPSEGAAPQDVRAAAPPAGAAFLASEGAAAPPEPARAAPRRADPIVASAPPGAEAGSDRLPAEIAADLAGSDRLPAEIAAGLAGSDRPPAEIAADLAGSDRPPAEIAAAVAGPAGPAGDPDRLLHSELMTARAHVELIGGSLHVSSREDDGVSILAEIPVAFHGGTE